MLKVMREKGRKPHKEHFASLTPMLESQQTIAWILLQPRPLPQGGERGDWYFGPDESTWAFP